jgi:hypothetical protein
MFSESHLNKLAEETGFKKRASKISPKKFIDILLYGSNEEYKSLNQCVTETRDKHNVSISKQGLDQRFNEGSVQFIKALFEKQLREQFSSEISNELLDNFNRVLVKDSTRYDIPEQHREQYPGSGGSASGAGISIQYEFDLKGGKVADINVTPSVRQDSTDALQTKEGIFKKDLVIRDLGYFSLEVFEYICENEAYFLSRLSPNVNVYQAHNGVANMLDYQHLYSQMAGSKQSTIEVDALIGQKKKMPTRLIVYLLPEAIYSERMRKVNRQHQKKGKKTSSAYQEYARFSFYITNIPAKLATANQLMLLYRLRWQIELVFKTWKSIFKVNKLGKMKLDRLLTLLYAKLLWILINWEIVINLKWVYFTKRRKTLSLYKSFQTIKEKFEEIRKELSKDKVQGQKIVRYLAGILNENHWLEKRKNRIGYEDILFKYL